MVARATLVAALLAAIAAQAQDDVPVAEPLLVRGSVAISPGFMMNQPTTNIYVVGKLEVFTDDKVSLRGEALWYIGSQQQHEPLQQNSQITCGPFVHFTHRRLDLALGFEPGVALSQPAPDPDFLDPAPLRIIPNMALCGGLTFAVWDYFQFFIDARYIHANYTGPYSAAIPLDEFVLGAGLGWQIPVKRLAKKKS